MDYQISWQPGLTLKQMELMVVGSAIRFYKGNKSQTAKALDINIKTLDTRLDEIIEIEDKEKAAEAERVKQREHFLARSRGISSNSQLNWTDSPAFTPESFQAIASDVPKTSREIHVQSASEVPAQQSVSMPKLEEVQKVLPRQVAGNSQRGRR